MNETYEWLYDHYTLSLIRVKEDAEEIKKTILAHSGPEAQMFLADQMDRLCMLWGTESFSIGLQLGLRLMAGQSPEGLMIS